MCAVSVNNYIILSYTVLGQKLHLSTILKLKHILECNLLCSLLMCYFQNANYTLNRLSEATKLVHLVLYTI